MTAGRVLAAYRVTFVACIVALSALSALSALTVARSASPHAHVVPLASAEIVAALLLLFRRTQRAGLAGLLAVFALAAALTLATTGQPPVHLVLYAASAVAIVMLDGRVTRDG